MKKTGIHLYDKKHIQRYEKTGTQTRIEMYEKKMHTNTHTNV